ncbi:endonuclease G, mitochondrial-like [Liolophura sinensis]|uniref:endonuclease G, mitochondrial-like n=1 Tax=Liolophura sinensis TaxID=3198878 RepID=UPI0031586A83
MLLRRICNICGNKAIHRLSGVVLNISKDSSALNWRCFGYVCKRHRYSSTFGWSDGEATDKSYQSDKSLNRPEVTKRDWQTTFERDGKDQTFPTAAGDDVDNYLTPDGLSKSAGNRKKSKFRADDEIIHQHYGAYLEDYRGSGYDRGHMAAAGNHRSSQEAINKTFLLSNILPQVGQGFNQGIWHQLEEGVRDIALISTCVHLYTGPLYIPRRDRNGEQYVSYHVIGGNRVAVPTHLFKTMLIGRMEKKRHYRYYMLSFIMPNVRVDDSAQIDEFIANRNHYSHFTVISRFHKLLPFNTALNNMIVSGVLGL